MAEFSEAFYCYQAGILLTSPSFCCEPGLGKNWNAFVMPACFHALHFVFALGRRHFSFLLLEESVCFVKSKLKETELSPEECSLRSLIAQVFGWCELYWIMCRL